MRHFASLEPDTAHHRTTRNIKRFKDGVDVIDLLNASDASVLNTSEVFRNGIDIIGLLNRSERFRT